MTPAELDAFAARFEAAAIPRAEWSHQAHLIVGAWHVWHFGAEHALVCLRSRIRRLNEINGVANTATGGYHETITAAYVRLLAAALDDTGSSTPLAARVTRLLASPLADRGFLSRFYSSGVLMSARARSDWVEPDLQPLPPRSSRGPVKIE